ncbi:hypothetical protein CVT24_009904 [Panaeolus cyanescens]|uniref:Uncharacterized protein n=1 Tax=Panaeolus cyanescens TaxID=181874 RepID=A0A409WFL5_9AGAR|nr:hypothetical protein CVT24_009904 [Panaeolus cyanescens]
MVLTHLLYFILLQPNTGPFASFLRLLEVEDLQCSATIYNIINQAATDNLDGSMVFSLQREKVHDVYAVLCSAKPNMFSVTEAVKKELIGHLLDILSSIHRHHIRFHWLKNNNSHAKFWEDEDMIYIHDESPEPNDIDAGTSASSNHTTVQDGVSNTRRSARLALESDPGSR